MKLFKRPKAIRNKLLPHTPEVYEGKNRIYVDELIGFIDNPKTNNIALMGDYGTGKSSILEQLKDEPKQCKCQWRRKDAIKTVSFLSFRTDSSKDKSRSQDEISRANVELNENGSGFNNPKSSKGKGPRSLIQSEFVRQLFYSVSPNKLRGSHYLRVGRTSPVFLKVLAIAVYAVILMYISGDVLEYIHTCIDMMLAFVMTMLTYVIAYIIVISAADYLCEHPPKLLGISGVEVALTDDNDNDLEQLLDEIIYFFNKTGCRVLIIEDVDRFNNLEIYEDLRDLSTILNSSRQPKEKITFIYAMRPSLLPDIEQRSKLFDAIVPVVPFVSSESSYGYASQTISDAMRDLDVPIEGIDNVINRAAHLISGLTSDARAIKEIANSIVIRARIFCHSDNSVLYRSNFLYVAVMAVVQEVSPSMYVALCNGSGNELDDCYSECLQMRQREIDRAKLNLQYKKDDSILRAKVSRELVLALADAFKLSTIYCFESDESQGNRASGRPGAGHRRPALLPDRRWKDGGISRAHGLHHRQQAASCLCI